MEQSGSLPRDLMLEFADRTGLASDRPPQRYLWTDAFAVCNFLELFRRIGEDDYKELALRLVKQVHEVLGRHRDDDPRRGWISGLEEEDGQRHPTAGGLRIGKELNERRPEEPFDDRMEWGRDGQYFHYLTKWMHALDRVSRVTADPTFNVWARELAEAAHDRFTYVPPSGGPRRMYWKMSIDLSRPLVPSMGLHDPLDGLVTYRQLAVTARHDFSGSSDGLGDQIADLEQMCRGQNWLTTDPLGIGGLLHDVSRMVQLMAIEGAGENGLLDSVMNAALSGLESAQEERYSTPPADHRLAFRELGLSIGLRAVERLPAFYEKAPVSEMEGLRKKIDALLDHMSLAQTIEGFWANEKNRQAASWREHREINMVMLATSLAPEGFVAI